MISYELMKKINAKNLTKQLNEEELEKSNELKSSMIYFKSLIETLSLREKEDEKSAILVGAFNMFGKKSEEAIKAYLSFSNAPSYETWENFRGFLLLGEKTAWQIWCENDFDAPRTGETESFPSVEKFIEYYNNSVDLTKKEYKRRLLEVEKEYYSLLHKGFIILKTFSHNCKLLNEKNESVLSGSYNDILEYIKKEHELNNLFFVVDEITKRTYVEEDLTQFLN